MKHASLALVLVFGCGNAPEVGFPCSDTPGAACTYAGVPGPAGIEYGVVRHRQHTLLNYPMDISFAPDGRMWIVDWNNHMYRRVEADDKVVTLVGNEVESDGTCFKKTPTSPCDDRDLLPLGDPVGAPGPEVSLNHPTDVVFFPNGDALLTAWHNNKLRIWEAATGIVKVFAGRNYARRGNIGDGGPAHLAEFNLPKGSEITADGRIYVVDSRNQRIRMIAPDDNRTISTVLGTGAAGFSGDGRLATDATIHLDRTGVHAEGAIAIAGDYLYLADTSNHRIRRMSLSTNIIDCIAGNSAPTDSGDGGRAVDAAVRRPHDIEIGPDDPTYSVDGGRATDAALHRPPDIEIGSGAPTYSSDGVRALDAALRRPHDIEIGPDGRLYIADTFNNVIRAIDLQTGLIYHVAGTGEECRPDEVCIEAEEGLPANQVRLNNPTGIAFDQAGHLYISDHYNNRIVRIARSW